MRITWGATVALAVVVAGAAIHMETVQAQAGATPTVDQFPALMKTISSTNTSLRAKMKENNLADAAKDAQKANTELTNVAGTCKQCHSTYREGGPPAGPYKFKEGSI